MNNNMWNIHHHHHHQFIRKHKQYMDNSLKL